MFSFLPSAAVSHIVTRGVLKTYPVRMCVTKQFIKRSVCFMSNQQETPYSIKYPFMVFMSQLFFAMMTMIQMQYQNAFMTDLARLPFLWIGTIASICNIVSTVFVFIQPFILQVVDFRIG